MSQERTTRGDGGLFTEDTIDGFIHRAFLRGEGLSALAVRRPVVGICSSWSELNPCNAGLDTLAAAVKRGVVAAGGTPLVFPTISISEPYSRPSSLLLRNLMAMDVEQMIVSSPIDAVVLLGGCDKTVPAQLMGAISAGRPALAIAAGPRPVQRWHGRTLTIDDLWPMADDRRRGLIADDDWARLEGCLNGGVGTCNVMGTATTMAVIAEVLGFALPGTSLLPSTSAARTAAAECTGRQIVAAVADPNSSIPTVTLATVENAFRVLCAVGGSTNALIHLIAIAGRACVEVSLDQLRHWSQTTPLIVDVRPSGEHLLADLDELGGLPAVVRELAPLLHVEEPTANGRTWRDVIAELPPRGGPALRSLDRPLHRGGALVILSGTLAPDGAVIKRSAADPRLMRHTGRAVVFDGVTDLRERIDSPDLDVDESSVLVLRGVGPKGGPGMPEVGHLPIPAKLLARGVRDMVRVSDARMSGTSTGTVVLHVAPEAAVGGPLGRLRNGDGVRLDVDAGVLDVLVDPEELRRRGGNTRLSSVRPARGFDQLHYDRVMQAPQGCDFDFLCGVCKQLD